MNVDLNTQSLSDFYETITEHRFCFGEDARFYFVVNDDHEIMIVDDEDTDADPSLDCCDYADIQDLFVDCDINMDAFLTEFHLLDRPVIVDHSGVVICTMAELEF